MSAAKQKTAVVDSFVRSGGSPPAIQNSQLAPAVPSLPAVPLLVPIKTASQMLGVSVFAMRVLCWDPKAKHILKPVRHGAAYLFAPASLKELADALVSGKIEFPRSPSKVKAKRKVAR
jgi:hypothetical protein